jgi:MoaA/NifB/PqqE/SkfB family radical SAM enzyme
VKTSGLIKVNNLPEEVKLIILLDDDLNLSKIVSNYKEYKNATILKIRDQDDAIVSSNVPKKWQIKPFTANQIIKKDVLKGLNMDEFFIKKLTDPCLTSKITIKSDGSVVPCLQKIDEVIGNIEKDEFPQIIKALSQK